MFKKQSHICFISFTRNMCDFKFNYPLHHTSQQLVYNNTSILQDLVDALNHPKNQKTLGWPKDKYSLHIYTAQDNMTTKKKSTTIEDNY